MRQRVKNEYVRKESMDSPREEAVESPTAKVKQPPPISLSCIHPRKCKSWTDTSESYTSGFRLLRHKDGGDLGSIAGFAGFIATHRNKCHCFAIVEMLESGENANGRDAAWCSGLKRVWFWYHKIV